MSTQIAPRPRTTRQPSRRPVTGPSPSRPTPVSPFRFGRDSCLPATVRDVSEQVRDPLGLRAELPDPGAWAATLARAIVEVVTGARQAQQLRRWLLPEIPRRRSPEPVRARHQPRPRSHLSH